MAGEDVTEQRFLVNCTSYFRLLRLRCKASCMSPSRPKVKISRIIYANRFRRDDRSDTTGNSSMNIGRNETFFNSSSIRQHLLDIGQSADSQRPAGTYARKIFSRLLIDLSWNSSRLEDNTCSLLKPSVCWNLERPLRGRMPGMLR